MVKFASSSSFLPPTAPGTTVAVPLPDNDSYYDAVTWLKAHDASWGDSTQPNDGQLDFAINGFFYDDGAVGRNIIADVGDTLVVAGNGDDFVWGSVGQDVLLGRGGKDLLLGDAGNDYLSGGDGDDRLFGGVGNDRLDGDSGNDMLFGGSGDDVLDGGAGSDLLAGGSGVDTVTYEDAASGVVASLVNSKINGGAAAGDMFNGIENLTGSGFTDNLYGDANANVISGGGGNDIIEGGNGNDVLTGGQGYDFVYGGSGDDTLDARGDFDFLSGGSGYDTVYLEGTAADWSFQLVSLYLNSNTGESEAKYNYSKYGDLSGDAGSMLGVERVIFDDGTMLYI